MQAEKHASDSHTTVYMGDNFPDEKIKFMGVTGYGVLGGSIVAIIQSAKHLPQRGGTFVIALDFHNEKPNGIGYTVNTFLFL